MVKSPPRERLRDPLARKSPPVALVAPGLWEPQDDEVLRLVEVSGERGGVELEEEGHLQAGVDAVHGGELPSCTSQSTGSAPHLESSLDLVLCFPLPCFSSADPFLQSRPDPEMRAVYAR